MEEKYYLAERGCSRGLQERLMLLVKDGKVKISHGESRDQFRLNYDDEPVCTTWDGISLAYSIRLLTNEEAKDLVKKDSTNGYSGAYFSTLQRKVHSVRGVRSWS